MLSNWRCAAVGAFHVALRRIPRVANACFHHESLRTWIKTVVNKFAISNHTALILGVHALRSYLKLLCKYELHVLSNTKVGAAENHGKIYIKVRSPLVCHLLRNRLLWIERLKS